MARGVLIKKRIFLDKILPLFARLGEDLLDGLSEMIL